MGAWGTGIFDDDTSCDLLADVIEDGALSFVRDALEIDTSDYIEYEDAYKIIVSAALIDTLLNQTDHHYPVDDFDTWLAAQPRAEILAHQAAILASLRLVLADSEITELWQENEEEFPEWQANIQALIDGLQPA